MAAIPIYNPPVPYVGYIDGGFGPGRMVRIQGGASSMAQRFAINLQCGPNTNPRDDIAFHLSPRFMENVIMRSCLQNQSWTGEESHGGMPLSRGQNFEIIILCDPAHYKVAVNGQHFVEYNHRIPFSRVTHLTIDGEVSVNLISFEGGYAPPPVAGNGVPGFAPMPSVPAPGMMAGGIPSGAPYPPQPGMPYAPQGPMPGYGAPPMYGGGYQQPGPQAYGAYGGYGGYGPGHPPPPPGYQQGKPGGGILDKAGLALAGALGGAGIMGAVGGKYPSVPQEHGDKGQGGSGSIGGLGTLGTLIGTGLAGAALSGVLGGKDNPATAGSNPDNKPKDPTHKDTPTTNTGGGNSASSGGGLGYLGTFISPGLAGAIQSGIMGGPDQKAAHNAKYPNPYAPSDPAAGGLGSLGTIIGSGLAGMMSGQGGSQPNPYNQPNPRYSQPPNDPAAGGLGSLGTIIGSGLAGIMSGQGGSQPNPYNQPNPKYSQPPSDPAAGGLGSLGTIIGSGLAGMMSGQGGSQPSPYRAPAPYGGGYPGQTPYGGGHQQGGGGGLESLGGLIGSGLAGAISSKFMSGGGGKEQSNRAAHLYSSKGDDKSNNKSGGKIDDDLIRSLDELIVGSDDKPLTKNVVKFSDAAPVKRTDESQLESGNEPEKADEEPEVKSDKKSEVESAKETPRKVIEDIDDIFAMYAEKPIEKSTSDTNRKSGANRDGIPVEEPVSKVDASDKP